MKQNLTILIFTIGLCAAVVGVFKKSVPDTMNASVVNQLPSAPVASDIKGTQTSPFAFAQPIATASPPISLKSAKEISKELSYHLKIEDGYIEFKLTNRGRSSHFFYSDSLDIRGVDGVPGHAEIELLKEDGSLFDAWDSELKVDSWSPLNLSSDAGTYIPAKSQTIGPGETRSLVVPLKDFFGRSDFVPNGKKYRVRILSNLYLDADLTQYIEARSNWVALKI